MRSAAAHCTATAGWHANGSGFSALGLGQQLRRSMPAAATSQQTTGISSREGEPGILADAGQSVQDARRRENIRAPPSQGFDTQQPGRTTAALLASRAVKAQEARALTRSITACTSWRQLAQLWEEHKGRMNHIHQTALVMHLARLATSPTVTGSSSSRSAVPQTAVRAGHITLPKRDLSHLRAFLAALVPYLGMHLVSYGPRQLAGVMWALGRLGYQPGPRWASEWAAAVSRKLHLLEPRDIAMCAWGASASGAASTSSPASGGVHGLLLQLAATLAQPQVSQAARPQDIANMWWALAAAGVQPEAEVLRGLEAALVRGVAGSVDVKTGSDWGRDSEQVVGSSSSSRSTCSGVSASIPAGAMTTTTGTGTVTTTRHSSSSSGSSASESGRAAHSSRPHLYPYQQEELGQVMWAMVKLGHCPSEACVRLMVDAYLAAGAGQQGNTSPSQQPAEENDAVPAQGDFGEGRPEHMASLAPSQRQQVLPTADRAHHGSTQAHMPQSADLSPEDGAGLQQPATSASAPPGQYLSGVPPTSSGTSHRQDLKSQKPPVSSTPQQPQQQQHKHRRSANNPQSAAHMLWGLARLHHRPPDHLISGLVYAVLGDVSDKAPDRPLTSHSSQRPTIKAASQSSARHQCHLTASDTAQAVWSCATLRYRPNPVQLVLLTQAVHQALEDTAVQGGTEEEPCMVDQWPDHTQKSDLSTQSGAESGTSNTGAASHHRPPPSHLGSHTSASATLSHPSSSGHTTGHTFEHPTGYTSHATQLPRQGAASAFTVSELSATMWALSRVGVQRLTPEQRCAFERAVTALVPAMVVTSPSSPDTSFSHYPPPPSSSLPSPSPQSSAEAATQRIPPSALSDLVLGAALVKARLPQPALRQVLAAAEAHMHSFQLRHLSRLLVGLAVMRCHPPRSFMVAASDHIHLCLLAQLPQVSPHDSPHHNGTSGNSAVPSPGSLHVQQGVRRRLKRSQASAVTGFSHSAAIAMEAETEASGSQSLTTSSRSRRDGMAGEEQLVLLPSGRVAKKQQPHPPSQEQQYDSAASTPAFAGAASHQPAGWSDTAVDHTEAQRLSGVQHPVPYLPAAGGINPMQPDDLVTLAWALAKLKHDPAGQRWGAVLAAHARLALPGLKPIAAARLESAMKRLRII